jgi:hypothetical protein
MISNFQLHAFARTDERKSARLDSDAAKNSLSIGCSEIARFHAHMTPQMAISYVARQLHLPITKICGEVHVNRAMYEERDEKARSGWKYTKDGECVARGGGSAPKMAFSYRIAAANKQLAASQAKSLAIHAQIAELQQAMEQEFYKNDVSDI